MISLKSSWRHRKLFLLGSILLFLILFKSNFVHAIEPCANSNVSDCEIGVSEHILTRIGFGGNDWTRQRIAYLGSFRYVLEQLYPQYIPDDEFEQQLQAYSQGPFATWEKPIELLRTQFCSENQDFCTDRRAGIQHINNQLGEIKLLRAIHSNRQLEAVLLDFWLNHFNVDGSIATSKWTMQSYEQDAIKPHVLGKFEDLLLAVTTAPAMLEYLDLKRSRRNNLNENFARELMELHTVGKNNTYDEQDVQEVSKVLTGYITRTPSFATDYNPNRHELGTKTVTLENTEPWVFDGTLGCGGRTADQFATEAEVLICKLALHPKTAELVIKKLMVRFLNETPDPDHVTAVKQVWQNTGGDLRFVLRFILLNKKLFDYKNADNFKFARPQVYTARLIRTLGVDVMGNSIIVNDNGNDGVAANSFNKVMGDLVAMGEALYKAGPPTGYPEFSAGWASAGTTLTRLQQVYRLVDPIESAATRWGVQSGATNEQILDQVIAALLPAGVKETTRTQILQFLNNDIPSNIGLNQRVRQTATLLLSSPDFLMH